MKLIRFLKKNTYQNPDRFFFVLTLFTGILSGVIAVALHDLVLLLTKLFKTDQVFTLETILWSSAALLLSGILTHKFFPYTSGSGIPSIRLALATSNGKIRLRDTVMKFITSIFSLSSGLSIGREGPTVSVTGGIGSYLGQIFKLPKTKMRTLVGIGSAGGIAAAFHTPIAAVVFTLEEIIGDLNATKMLGPIILSAVSASVTASILKDGDLHIFTQLSYKMHDNRELIFYLVIGIVTAILGVVWSKSVIWLRGINKKVFNRFRLVPIFIALASIAGISFYFPEALGSSHKTLEDVLLSLVKDWKLLIMIFGAKFVATTISYASGVSGGLFMPTLMMGAMVGGVVGSLAQALFPEFAGNLGAYALVGMGSFFVSVIRAPFTSIIMVFELTRDYNVVLPLMVANIVSWLISTNIHKGSIYENLALQDGMELPDRQDSELLGEMVVEEVMESTDIIDGSTLVKNFFNEIGEDDATAYPVVWRGSLIGVVSKNEIALSLTQGLGEEEIHNIHIREVISIFPDQSLMVALHKLNYHHVSRLYVVSRLNRRKLVGVISAQSILKHFS